MTSSSSLVDQLLNLSFNDIQESVRHTRDERGERKQLLPDAEGCIYEIKAPIQTSFDFCSSFAEAQKIAKGRYHEYSIWKIFVGNQKRVCLEIFEERQANNVIRAALLHKNRERN